MTRATDRRAAGVRSGASSRAFSWAASWRRSSRRRTRAWYSRTSGAGGAHRPPGRALVAGVGGDQPGVGLVRLVPPPAHHPGVPDAGRVDHADRPAGGVEVGGEGVLVPAGGLHPEVGRRPGLVTVGPGGEGGEPVRGVGGRLLPGLPVGGQEAGVAGGLGDVDPDHGRGGGAHGVPPLKLTDAGSTRPGGPRGSVRGRGAPAAGPPPGSRGRAPHPPHAVGPTTGPSRRAGGCVGSWCRLPSVEAGRREPGGDVESAVSPAGSARRCRRGSPTARSPPPGPGCVAGTRRRCRPRTHAGARILRTHVHGSSGAARGAGVAGILPAAEGLSRGPSRSAERDNPRGPASTDGNSNVAVRRCDGIIP